MISDEQIAVRAKTDDLAFAALAIRYRPVMRGIARDRFAPGLEREDLDQAAAVGLWKGVLSFDPSRGSFRPLAQVTIQRNVDTAVKTALREKHQILSEADRVVRLLDGDEIDAVDSFAVEGSDPAEVLIRREWLATVVRVVTEDLTPLEHGVAVGQMDGESYLETARRIGLRHTTRPDGLVRSKPVDNALARVKRKMRAALQEAA